MSGYSYELKKRVAQQIRDYLDQRDRFLLERRNVLMDKDTYTIGSAIDELYQLGEYVKKLTLSACKDGVLTRLRSMNFGECIE